MTTQRDVYYEDLIGAPYRKGGRNPLRGIDCAGVCIEIMQRLGMDPPDDNCDLGDYFSRYAGEFEKVGDTHHAAREAGDLIVSAPIMRGVSSHVSIYADVRADVALTAHETMGVIAVKPWAIQGIEGVYRWLK